MDLSGWFRLVIETRVTQGRLRLGITSEAEVNRRRREGEQIQRLQETAAPHCHSLHPPFVVSHHSCCCNFISSNGLNILLLKKIRIPNVAQT